MLDVNDNQPSFEKSTYQTTITEGDDKKLPKRILQVNINNLSIYRVHNPIYSTSNPHIAPTCLINLHF